MYTRIVAALVLAAALSAGAWKAYSMGKASVQTEWDADVAQRTAQALEAEKAARAKEQELQTKVGRVDRAYQDQKRATATVAAAAADGLRNLGRVELYFSVTNEKEAQEWLDEFSKNIQ